MPNEATRPAQAAWTVLAHICPVLRPALVAFSAIVAMAAPGHARADVLAAVEDEQRAVFERVEPSVVVISNGGTISAGFVAAPGFVVTSAHGVLGASDVAITLRDGRVVRGAVVACAPRGLDVALLHVPEATGVRVLAPAPRAALRAGDVVFAVGHGDGNRWSLSTGMVSNPTPDGADGALVRLQLGVRPGTSGGPVVDRAGRLIGVVVHGDPGTLAFALRTDAVLRAFPALGHDLSPHGARTDRAGTAAVLEDPPVTTVRAPELIAAPADPRPRPARMARGRNATTPVRPRADDAPAPFDSAPRPP